IGFYFGFLGLLLLTHIQTYERLLLVSTNQSIIKLSWNTFLSFVNGHVEASQLGGGLIGGLLFAFNYYLFSSIGAKIVAVFSMIIGFIFMTEFSIGDFFVNLSKKFVTIYKNSKDKFTEFRNNREKDLV